MENKESVRFLGSRDWSIVHEFGQRNSQESSAVRVVWLAKIAARLIRALETALKKGNKIYQSVKTSIFFRFFNSSKNNILDSVDRYGFSVNQAKIFISQFFSSRECNQSLVNLPERVVLVISFEKRGFHANATR